MRLHRSLAFFLIAGCIFITGNLIYLHKRLYNGKTFHQDSFVAHAIKIGDETSTKLSGKSVADLRPFIYLTQTEQCLPLNLANSIGDSYTCNCDVVVLSYKAECKELTPSHVTYVYEPQSTWGSGRNTLYFCALNRAASYHYYMFLDDDITLKFNALTPAKMKKMHPFKAVQEWLLDYEPAVGVLDYAEHHGAK